MSYQKTKSIKRFLARFRGGVFLHITGLRFVSYASLHVVPSVRILIGVVYELSSMCNVPFKL